MELVAPDVDGVGFGRVAGNAAWYAAADLIGKVASFVLAVVLAKHLGAREYGYFTFAISFFPLFLVLAQWGIEVSVMHEVAKDPSSLGRVYGSALRLRVILDLAALAVATGLMPLVAREGAPLLAIAVVGGALLLDEVSRLHSAVFTSMERMRVSAVLLLVNRIVSTCLAVLVVARGGGLLAVCVTYLLGSFGATISGFLLFRRMFPSAQIGRTDRSMVKRLLSNGTTLAIAGFFNMAVFRLDAVLLETIKGPEQVAQYGVAYRFFEPLLFVAWSIGSASLPRLTREVTAGIKTRTFELTLTIALAFYLPIAAGGPFAGRWLVVLLFSDRYRPAAGAVIWLTAAAVPYAIAFIARMGAISVGRRRAITTTAAAALVVNLALNLALIPRHGFVGAAAVTLGTELLEAVILLWVYGHARGGRGVGLLALAPLLGAASMVAVLAATGLRDAQAIVIGAFVYLATLLLAARALGRAPLRTPQASSERARDAQPPTCLAMSAVGASCDRELVVEAHERLEPAHLGRRETVRNGAGHEGDRARISGIVGHSHEPRRARQFPCRVVTEGFQPVQAPGRLSRSPPAPT